MNTTKCGWCGGETTEQFCSQEHAENSVAFHILENLTEELPLVYKATAYPWKVELTNKSYTALLHRPGTQWVPAANAYLPQELIYEKDGHEYLVCWENHNIPFIVHARISSKNAIVDGMRLDDLNRPNIQEEYNQDWQSMDYLNQDF